MNKIEEIGVCYWVGNNSGTQFIAESVDTAMRFCNAHNYYYRFSSVPLLRVNGRLYGPINLMEETEEDKKAGKARIQKLKEQSAIDFARMQAIEKATAAGLTKEDIKALSVK